MAYSGTAGAKHIFLKCSGMRKWWEEFLCIKPQDERRCRL
jgi:hypothetical protein